MTVMCRDRAVEVEQRQTFWPPVLLVIAPRRKTFSRCQVVREVAQAGEHALDRVVIHAWAHVENVRSFCPECQEP